MAQILAALASTYPVQSPPLITFVSIDAEALPDVSDEYEVSAVPFLVLTQGNKVLETVSGSDASKVRDAVQRNFVKLNPESKGGPIAASSLPPAQNVVKPENGAAMATAETGNTGGVVKDLSGYAAKQDDGAKSEEPKPLSEEELHTRLSSLVKAAPVMLFMKGTPSSPQCGFSRQLVALLRGNGVRYGFFNILADEEVRQGLKKFADWPTYPQLWASGELIGGLDIVSSGLACLRMRSSKRKKLT
jgi:Grx4 family monothiol glutaredoxin